MIKSDDYHAKLKGVITKYPLFYLPFSIILVLCKTKESEILEQFCNKGQNGAEIHLGTTSTPNTFSDKHFLTVFEIKTGGGTSHIFDPVHEKLNASMPLVPGHQDFE